MALNLIKLCVGAESVEDLAAWVKERAAQNAAAGEWGRVSHHVTRMFPRRSAELLDGGSLYWVIKGIVLVRQRIVGMADVTGEDGVDRCAILLQPKLAAVEAQPRRAFQGWRYLKAEDAPEDLKPGARREPPALRAKLAELGLL